MALVVAPVASSSSCSPNIRYCAPIRSATLMEPDEVLKQVSVGREGGRWSVGMEGKSL